jgi:hypothetical protein
MRLGGSQPKRYGVGDRQEDTMTYELVNDSYGNEQVSVTIEDLYHVLRDVFGNHETELVERIDGIYEVGGALVARAIN